jgi:hypothetical protein
MFASVGSAARSTTGAAGKDGFMLIPEKGGFEWRRVTRRDRRPGAK